jgi:hypothetical protein
MKFVFAILTVVIVAALFHADVKWRRWIAARRHNRTPADRK